MEDGLDLWGRLAAFDVDGDAQPGYFVEKLARENGWSRDYATRVLEEYRRYVYLACTADHVVVPSDQVDVVWHQHLVDTEQYWEVFCKTVLDRPLHHLPSKGGQLDRHMALYLRTMHAYADAFDCEPPRDIWPPPTERFGQNSDHRRVATASHWILPKPGIPALACAGAIASAAVIFGSTVFAWNVAEVFAAFAVATILAFSVTVRIRRSYFGPAYGRGRGSSVALDPYDAALLRQDATSKDPRAVNTAVAALFFDGALGFDEAALANKKQTYRLVHAGPRPPQSHPLERAVYEDVASATDGALLSEVHLRMRPSVELIRDSLRERGLLGYPHHRGRRRWMTALPIIVVGTVGVIASFALGSRGMPWAPLLAIPLPILLLVALFMSSPPHTTAIGRDALSAAWARYKSMASVGRDDVADGRALSWIVALYGFAAVEASLSPLPEAIAAPASVGGGGEPTSANDGCGCGGG
jgi:uncharacterized protein (TIGR04222 family)